MPTLAPVDYGPAVQPDTSGISAGSQLAERRQEQARGALGDVGNWVGTEVHQVAQALVQSQSLKATADAKETQSKLLDYIESTPYVSKDDLRERMAPSDYESWHASLDPEYKSKDVVPMYKVGSALFESGAKQAREQASQYISAPGWRERWTDTDRAETATFKSDRLNRVMAGQMVNDQRVEAKTNLNRLVDSAKSAQDIDLAIAAMRGNGFLHPAEKQELEKDALQARDRMPAMQSMNALDVPGMRAELTKLENPETSKQFFSHTGDEARLHLQTQLRSHIAIVENMLGSKRDLEEKWRKQQDDRTLGAMATRLVKGDDPSELLSLVKQRALEDHAPGTARNGFYETPKMLEGYHLLQAAIKNQKEGPQQDQPGALRAITSLYADTQDLNGDAFRKAMLTPGGVDIPGYGHFNPELDLSNASYKAQLSRLDTLASTDRGRVEREREGSHQMRVTSVLLDAKVPVKDLTNPLQRIKYDRMIAFMEDAVKRKAQSRGRTLSSDEETIEMTHAAKVFKDNAGKWGPWNVFNNDVGKDGINITTQRGTVSVGPEELATLHTTAREMGAPSATIGSAALKNYVTDFYDNYAGPAQNEWQSKFGSDIKLDDAYRVFWRAKFLQSKADPAARVRMVINRMAVEEAQKKQGGTK
jgi:hypothetical protein